MSGVELIEQERKRQAKYDAAHDDGHGECQMVEFAEKLLSYYRYPVSEERLRLVMKESDDWTSVEAAKFANRHAADPMRHLAIAGAMIAAEIDRLKRIQGAELFDKVV